MNTLENKLQKDLVEAMKAKNEPRISAVRSIKTAIQVEKTNGSYHELSDDDIVKIIQKLSKQRQESYDLYAEAGRNDLAEKEKDEKVYLDEYLPKMLGEDELESIVKLIVSEVGATTMKDMGKVMKELSSRYPNQYDGKTASTLIKSMLLL